MNTPTFEHWDDAFHSVRVVVQAPAVVMVQGRRYKLYPSGRVLCAATRPYHKPHHETPDGHCGCMEIEGDTIATIRLRIDP